MSCVGYPQNTFIMWFPLWWLKTVVSFVWQWRLSLRSPCPQWWKVSFAPPFNLKCFHHLHRLSECSELCSKTVFQSTQTWSCAASSSNSSLVAGPSQSRLQTVNHLLQFLLWPVSCLSLWPHSVHPFSADTWILCILHVKTETFGQRSFSYCAPKQ